MKSSLYYIETFGHLDIRKACTLEYVNKTGSSGFSMKHLEMLTDNNGATCNLERTH